MTRVVTSGMFGATAGRLGSGAGPRGVSVMAVDPGETTGWAWACVAYKELRLVDNLGWADLFGRLQRSERFQCGQVEIDRGPLSASSVAAKVAQAEAFAAMDLAITIEGLHGVSRDVSRGTVGWVTDLVIEDFILRQRTQERNLLAPVRLTAALVQEVLRSERLIGLSFQSASDAKSVVTDDRLRSLGLWQVGQVHARDACRHLALFLRRLVAE